MGGQVARELVDCVFGNHTESWQIVKDVRWLWKEDCGFWLRRYSDIVSKPVREVVFVTKDTFCCCNPVSSPASTLEVNQLVTGV